MSLLRPGGARRARGPTRLLGRAVRLAALPLEDVHPHAEIAAEATEAAAAQGAFWPMHDLLLAHQGALDAADLLEYAEQLGLDVDRFADDLRSHAGARRIAEDVEGADLSGVTGTPTFFVNGRRHYGA